jgi:glycosyltransferase involved in cell wall biosynthesis
MAKQRRYLLVWDRMGDYHVARWRAMQTLLGVENVFAADLCAADNLYGWETAWGQDPNYRLFSSKNASQTDVGPRLGAFIRLLKENGITHVALAGYGRPEYRLMALYARLNGFHVTLFAESWYPASAAWKDRLKGLYVSVLGQSFFVSGARAASHFNKKLGIHSKRIAIGYSVVDNAHFVSGIGSVPKQKNILCVARFAPEKNLERLIAAFAASSLPTQGFQLHLVGGGPLAQVLAEKQAQYPWLVLQNWLSYAELPTLYAAAQGFILASTFEPWGLVVNEALAAGLPVASSQAVGAVPDLLGQYQDLVFDPESLPAITNALEKLALAPAPDPSALAPFSPQSWAQTLVRLGELP